MLSSTSPKLKSGAAAKTQEALQPVYGIPVDMYEGSFAAFGRGFLLPKENLPFRTKVQVGDKLSLTCMFNMNWIVSAEDGRQLGLLFRSHFEVVHQGGYLLTYMQNRPKATEYDRLVYNDYLVLYNYHNRGSLAISPKVSADITAIFEEQ